MTQSNILWCSQKISDLPNGSDWLSNRELNRLKNMRSTRRRADWRLGRWTAKQALLPYLNKSHNIKDLREIEILAAEDSAPEVFIDNKPAPVAISLSHSGEIGFCAINTNNTPVGCDLEFVDSHSDSFISDYFTVQEQELMNQVPKGERPFYTTLIWSAKESALKALRKGLSLDTRSVQVDLTQEPGTEIWHPMSVEYTESSQVFHGWWREFGDSIYTIVTDPRPGIPVVVTV